MMAHLCRLVLIFVAGHTSFECVRCVCVCVCVSQRVRGFAWVQRFLIGEQKYR
jgi:hypothetical protein